MRRILLLLSGDMKAILGTKVGMTHIFDEAGNMIPVTVLSCAPNTILQRKTAEKDGYDAIQLGFEESKRLNKPSLGHQAKAGTSLRHIKEIRIDSEHDGSSDVGHSIDVTEFAAGDIVDVIGTSKGKGFAGTIKRHNFSRGPMSHGSHNKRRPGSIGAGYPEHVFRGQKMSGHMGADRVTAKKLTVAAVDKASSVLMIKGAIPGPAKGLVMVRGY